MILKNDPSVVPKVCLLRCIKSGFFPTTGCVIALLILTWVEQGMDRKMTSQMPIPSPFVETAGLNYSSFRVTAILNAAYNP